MRTQTSKKGARPAKAIEWAQGRDQRFSAIFMDAAGDLRHGASRNLTVVAAIGVLEHELELVRVSAISCYMTRCNDIADGRRQFIRATVVGVRPAVLASNARQHLAFDRLARGIKPHRRARPGVDHRVALWAHIKPALDGRGAG